MHSRFIALSTLLTWSILQISVPSAPVQASALAILQHNPYPVAGTTSATQGTKLIRMGGETFRHFNHPHSSAGQYPVISPDAPVHTGLQRSEPVCRTTTFVEPQQHARWSATTRSAVQQAPACKPRTVTNQGWWGMNRAQVVATMPYASVCSLAEITHLGHTNLRPVNHHLATEGSTSPDWIRQSRLGIAHEGESAFRDHPMCLRAAKLVEGRGPNPWAGEALTVRLGPDVPAPVPRQWMAATAPAVQHQSGTATFQTISHTPPPQSAVEPAPQAAAPPAALSAGSISPGYSGRTPLPMSGLAMYYNPGVMSQVVDNRKNLGGLVECSECIGYAALLRAGDLNRKIWIQWGDGAVEGPFLVADVAAPQHVDMLVRRGWVVDVDNRTANRRGLFMPVHVTIYDAPPSTASRPVDQSAAQNVAQPTMQPTPQPTPQPTVQPTVQPAVQPASPLAPGAPTQPLPSAAMDNYANATMQNQSGAD